MTSMLTVKEVSLATKMSEYAIRQGVRAGIYPAIRVCGNPKGKILINIEEFITTINKLSHQPTISSPSAKDSISLSKIRQIAE